MAGVGNVTMVAGLRATVKAVEIPPEPKVRAPVLDPTFGGGGAVMRCCYPSAPSMGAILEV